MIYHLMQHDTYYPSGGIGDCMGDFESVEEATKYLRERSYLHDESYLIAFKGNSLVITHEWVGSNEDGRFEAEVETDEFWGVK